MNEIEEMYKDNFQIVYKYLLIMTKNEDIAEELTQETFYKAIKNINKFNGESKLSTWLCQIAKNTYLNDLKKNKKMMTLTDTNYAINEDENIFSCEEKLKLFKNIQKLKSETKDVIYLRLSGELTFKEIAQIMNKTESWVRVTFYRGRLKLKEDDENEKRM